jgi:Tfp pilus assembly protein PilF
MYKIMTLDHENKIMNVYGDFLCLRNIPEKSKMPYI